MCSTGTSIQLPRPSSPNASIERSTSSDWEFIRASGPTLPASESDAPTVVPPGSGKFVPGAHSTAEFSTKSPPPTHDESTGDEPDTSGDTTRDTSGGSERAALASESGLDIDEDWQLVDDFVLEAAPSTYADDLLHLCPKSQLGSLSDVLSAPAPAPTITSGSVLARPPSTPSTSYSASSRPAGTVTPAAPLPAISADGQRIAGAVRAILSSSSPSEGAVAADRPQLAEPGNTVEPQGSSEPHLDSTFLELARRLAFWGSSTRSASLDDWSPSLQKAQTEDENLQAANIFGLSYARGSIRDCLTVALQTEATRS